MKKIILDTFEYLEAWSVAGKRLVENIGRPDADYYDNGNKEDEVRANVATCCCEKAVAKYLNIYWSSSAWKVVDHKKFKNLPDVGNENEGFEVRRIRTEENPVTIRKTDKEKNMTVIAAYAPLTESYREVYIMGFIDAKKGWEIGEFPIWDDGKQKSKVVPISELSNIENIFVNP
jgi:hypothetical protein